MSRTRANLWGLSMLCALIAFALVKSQTPPAYAEKAAAAKLDAPVTPFKLHDINHTAKEGEKPDADKIAINAFKGKKPVVLFFLSEKCGTTWRYEKRFGQLLQKYGKKDVAFFGVRCSANDTPESLQKFAQAKNFDMPLLDDADGSMTRYFNVSHTPTFVLIDKKGALRYIGSFDDAASEQNVSKRFLPDAVAAVVASKPVPVKQNPAFG